MTTETTATLPIDAKRTQRFHIIALVLLCLAFFVPGIATLPPTDRDEARFTQATKQMVESGDYADISFQETKRYKKPIGIYWLQAAAVQLTQADLNDIWAYRLPSLLASILSVVLTYLIGARLFNPATGFMAALLLGGSLIMGVEARLAKTDAALLASILAAQYALINIWLAKNATRSLQVLFWVALGAGTLIKGPIIFLPVLFTLAALCWRERSASLLRQLAPQWGVPLMLAIILPWLIMITIKSGGNFWVESVGKDLLAKAARGQESHAVPPGYHLAVFWAMFWPGSILAFLALPFVWRERKAEKIFMLLAWIIPTFIVFELTPTKLPHYALPTYPAIALLTAAALHYGLPAFRRAWIGRAAWVVWAVVSAGILIAFSTLPTFAAGDIAVLQLVMASLVGGLLIWWALHNKKASDTANTPTKRVLLLTLIGAAFLVPLFGHSLPAFNHIWIARQVQQALAEQTNCPSPSLISARFNEPSLVFLIGTNTIIDANGMEAAAFLDDASPCRFALVSQKEWGSFITTLDQLDISADRVASIRGFSYGGGDEIDMQLVKKYQ